jgi:uncharacterized membrane protein
MTLAPLLSAAPEIQVHVVAVTLAIGLLGPQLAMKKGTGAHRVIGWTWIFAMAVAALSSFWIHTIRLWGPFSPIHLLAVVTLGGLIRGVILARQGDALRHGRIMVRVALGGLIVAGLFTLLPGRLMHAVFWPS